MLNLKGGKEMTNKEAIEQLKWVGNRICQITYSPETFDALDLAIKALEERPQGECRTCRYRDPEDKKCDCGALERQGCPFPVSDNYFCKFYEKDGAENEQ